MIKPSKEPLYARGDNVRICADCQESMPGFRVVCAEVTITGEWSYTLDSLVSGATYSSVAERYVKFDHQPSSFSMRDGITFWAGAVIFDALTTGGVKDEG